MQFVVQQHYDFKEDRARQVIDFQADAITLNLPNENVEGWKIIPLEHPEVTLHLCIFLHEFVIIKISQISKVNVKQFQLGRNIPACHIELEWKGGGEPKELSPQTIYIIGAKEPNNYFKIRYYPQATGKFPTNKKYKEDRSKCDYKHVHIIIHS